MLLTLRSLWEEQAGNDVIVSGEGVAADPQIGTGALITTGAGGGIRKRRRKPRAARSAPSYWVPVRMPVPINVECTGEGVAARPRIGTGNVLIGVDLSDDELIALLMAGGLGEGSVYKNLCALGQLACSRGALAENCAAN
jgi:hypothetical protein